MKAYTLTAGLVKGEVWLALLMPEALGDAATCVGVVFTVGTVGLVWWTRALTRVWVKHLGSWAVCWCVWTLAPAAAGIEGLARLAGHVLAHALACVWIQHLVLSASLEMVWAGALAADRVHLLWGRAADGWTLALAVLCVKDMVEQGALLGDVRTHTLTRLWVYLLCLVAYRLVGADAGACVLVEGLGCWASGTVRTDTLA